MAPGYALTSPEGVLLLVGVLVSYYALLRELVLLGEDLDYPAGGEAESPGEGI